MINPRQHELLAIVLFGAGTAIIFLGYNVQIWFAESVVHSLHKLYPDTISQYAGYYGTAIHYFVFAFCSLFTASMSSVMSSKVALVLVALLFCTYYVGFYHLNGYYYYFSQLLMGLGYACRSRSHGSIFCGAFLFVFNYFFSNTVEENTNYRKFSIGFIQIMYSSLLAVTLLGGFIFAFLPMKQQSDSLARKSSTERFSIKDKFKKMYNALFHVNMLLLAVTFTYQGFFNSLNQGIYSTTLSFTYSLKDDIYLIAFYSLFVGFAQIIGFSIINPLVSRVPKHRLIVFIIMHLLSIFLAMLLINCTTPNEATIRPSPNGNLLIEPSRWTVSLTGFLLGLSDYTITVSRCVICQVAIPEARAEVFSLTRSASACCLLFLAPMLNLRMWTLIILIGATLGTTTFIIVVRKTGSSIRPTNENQL